MSEGYYSPGPNPNLRKFVEEHAKPYDPETDDYNVPPFDIPITTTKATAIYNMHTYWSKKPHDAIQQYIRHYTQPGDLVLDPFCGSGGTALAALMEGRAAIAIDLSPAATFIAKNYCTPVDVNELQRAFEELTAKVKSEIDWLYETRCDRCDGKATTAYTVYSQVFQCPRCLLKVALFDCPEMESTTHLGKPKKIRVCPNCKSNGVVEEISTRSMRFGSIPVLVSYICEEGCKPQQTERRHNDPNLKKREFFEKFDLAKIGEIDTKEIPYWYPKVEFPKNFARWNSDLKGIGVSTVADMFTKRNLWALAIAYYFSKQQKLDASLLGLNAIVLAMSRLQGYIEDPRFPNQLLRGTYYIPPTGREYNVLSWYGGKVDNLIRGYKKLNESLVNSTAIISTQTATNVETINDDLIDYIFTDPPYSGNVQYGELNFVWEAWLGFATNWHEGEIIVNPTRRKTMDDWAEMIRQAMSECFRVLKPGRWISLCYHDTSEGTWQLLQDIMAEVGFIADRSDETLFIDAGQKSFNQLTGDKVTKRDLVINFRKPRAGEIAEKIILTGEEDASTFTEKARVILTEALIAHPGSTADRLYDELVSRMVRKGQFERHNFDELLRSVAEETNGRWYLLATADQVDEAESKKETSSAARLDTFMQNFLKEHSGEAGVHYSDLFEKFLLIKDKPRRYLNDWLPEFFFKTPDGTWRPPATDEERQQKAALRSSGALRRIKRFTSALLDGVPPHDGDKPENAATLADWIRQCRRAGFYDLGRALYEKGGLQFDELNETVQLQVEEDYQICVRRSERPVKPVSKGRQLSLVEE